ncbi:MAG: hypothetical protein PGN37_20440 [Mycobacterium kyogaense]|uniref:hypothetical protein n=1 Tax=Mycobacterium kyogaense TaxID=2212479 RepID=UPI002FF59DE4
MSLYVSVHINDELVERVEVTRDHDDNGTDPEAVNTYRWHFRGASGEITHRYGNGAIELAQRALHEVATRLAVASTIGLTSEQVDARLSAFKFSPDGSIFGPDSLQDICDRVALIGSTDCPCGTSPHLNALHDLALTDLPALLRVLG